MRERDVEERLADAWQQGFAAGSEYIAKLNHWSLAVLPHGQDVPPAKPKNPYLGQETTP